MFRLSSYSLSILYLFFFSFLLLISYPSVSQIDSLHSVHSQLINQQIDSSKYKEIISYIDSVYNSLSSQEKELLYNDGDINLELFLAEYIKPQDFIHRFPKASKRFQSFEEIKALSNDGLNSNSLENPTLSKEVLNLTKNNHKLGDVDDKVNAVKVLSPEGEKKRMLEQSDIANKYQGGRQFIDSLQNGITQFVLQENPRWWEYINLEGSLGFFQGKIRTGNISPIFNYNPYKNISLGLGPSFQYSSIDFFPSRFLLGLRTIANIQLTKSLFYLRFENTIAAPEVSYISATENSQYETQEWSFNPMIGGGISFQEKFNFPLQIQVLYNFNQDFPGPAFQNPWQVTLGWSLQSMSNRGLHDIIRQ